MSKWAYSRGMLSILGIVVFVVIIWKVGASYEHRNCRKTCLRRQVKGYTCKHAQRRGW